MSAFAPIVFSKKPSHRVVLFALAGILPISSIALHCSGVLSLSNCLLFVILPLIATAFIIGAVDRALIRLVFRGWISGIIAVAIYDLSRIPFVYAGWDDFIPHISAWLVKDNTHPYLFGYAWRYIGNGGGLGIVFFLFANHFGWKKYVVSNAVTFGLFVYIGLLALLIFFPDAQQLMFSITPLSFFGGLTGHLVYGFVLGRMHQQLIQYAGKSPFMKFTKSEIRFRPID